MTTISTETGQNEKMQRYYRRHARIYDLSRWTFLFGRKKLIRLLPFPADAHFSVLEIGCGTGYNLLKIARKYPNARLTGLDVSEDMIHQATDLLIPYQDRVQLIRQPYRHGQTGWENTFDLIVFSYSLTMINPHWESLIRQAKIDLKPGGWIAATDFHNSRFGWFKRHMGANHVRMDGHLTPVLEHEFDPVTTEINGAYGGVWQYFVFVGKKRTLAGSSPAGEEDGGTRG